MEVQIARKQKAEWMNEWMNCQKFRTKSNRAGKMNHGKAIKVDTLPTGMRRQLQLQLTASQMRVNAEIAEKAKTFTCIFVSMAREWYYQIESKSWECTKNETFNISYLCSIQLPLPLCCQSILFRFVSFLLLLFRCCFSVLLCFFTFSLISLECLFGKRTWAHCIWMLSHERCVRRTTTRQTQFVHWPSAHTK